MKNTVTFNSLIIFTDDSPCPSESFLTCILFKICRKEFKLASREEDNIVLHICFTQVDATLSETKSTVFRVEAG